MTHTVKGFSVVNEAEGDVFLESACFFCDTTDVGNLISGSSARGMVCRGVNYFRGRKSCFGFK